jgi:hypothetical protein
VDECVVSSNGQWLIDEEKENKKLATCGDGEVL